MYIVEFYRSVLLKARSAAASPEYDPAKPCVYDALTGLDPEER